MTLVPALALFLGVAPTTRAATGVDTLATADPQGKAPSAGVLEIAPAGGVLGEQPLFVLRGAYTISQRLAIEAEIGHNVGDIVSAYLHSAGLRVTGARYRAHSAFATVGFGTFGTAGGDAIAAQSVTRTHLRLGGGIAIRLRDDFGARLDLRHHRVLLGDRGAGSSASVGANEISFGLVFSRRVGSTSDRREGQHHDLEK